MSKRGVAAIFAVAVLVLLCTLSPLLFSRLQNRNLVDVTHFEKNKKLDIQNNALPLFQKINIYCNNTLQEQGPNRMQHQSLAEGDTNKDGENSKILKNAMSELQMLHAAGLIPVNSAEVFRYENISSFWMGRDTCIEDSLNAVTILNLEMNLLIHGEMATLSLKVEEESGKIFSLYMSGFQLLLETDALIDAPELWRQYLGANKIVSVGKREIVLQQGEYILCYYAHMQEDTMEMTLQYGDIGVSDNGEIAPKYDE